MNLRMIKKITSGDVSASNTAESRAKACDDKNKLQPKTKILFESLSLRILLFPSANRHLSNKTLTSSYLICEQICFEPEPVTAPRASSIKTGRRVSQIQIPSSNPIGT